MTESGGKTSGLERSEPSSKPKMLGRNTTMKTVTAAISAIRFRFISSTPCAPVNRHGVVNQESYGEGLATRTGPKSYGVVREDGLEASTKKTGRASSRERSAVPAT